MNESRMSPSGVSESSVLNILKVGSTNNAAGALTQGAQAVIEAELKAQASQLEAASDFAETSANIVKSQLSEVQEQADNQSSGDSESAWGEIGGGIAGLTMGVGSFGVGVKGVASDSDELNDLNSFGSSLDEVSDSDVVAQGSGANPKSLNDEVIENGNEIQGQEIKIQKLEDELAVAKEDLLTNEERIKGEIDKLNQLIKSNEEKFEKSVQSMATLTSQVKYLQGELGSLESRRDVLDKSIEAIEKEQGLVGRNSLAFRACSKEKERLNAELNVVGRKLESNSEEIESKEIEIKREMELKSESEELLKEYKKNRDEQQIQLEILQKKPVELGDKLFEARQGLDDLKETQVKLEKQKSLFEKLTNPVLGDNGKIDLDLTGLNNYDKETQKAVLDRLSADKKKALKASFEKARSKAKETSDALKHQKGAHVASLLQCLSQVAPSIGQGSGTQAGVNNHLQATVNGALAQVDSTVSGQYDQAGSGLSSQAASNLQTALQVAASIRG